MAYLQDGIVAMLAAIGIATLLWLLVSLFLKPRRETLPHAVVLLPARGSGSGMEHGVRLLRELRLTSGGFGAIVIVDCGLNEEGRQMARLLTRQERDISLAAREELVDFLQ